METHQETTAFLGLGGNLGEPLSAFRRARQKLNDHPAISLCRSSPVYLTPPVGGPPGQPDYLNAALMIKTTQTPQELLKFCLSLEVDAGRERHERWGARILDIDLLLFGEELIRDEMLEIPHPRMMERQFVLLPLATLAPDFRHPQSGVSIQGQLNRLPIVEAIQILQLDW